MDRGYVGACWLVSPALLPCLPAAKAAQTVSWTDPLGRRRLDTALAQVVYYG